MSQGLMAAGSVIGAIGSLQQGEAGAASARYSAGINDRNAAVSESQGTAAALQQQQIGYRRLSAAGAAYGASGITRDGSPLDVLASSAENATLDVQKIRYGTELKVMGYQENANLDRMRAKQSQRAGQFGAAAALLTGGSKAYAMGGTPGAGTPIPSMNDNYVGDLPLAD